MRLGKPLAKSLQRIIFTGVMSEKEKALKAIVHKAAKSIVREEILQHINPCVVAFIEMIESEIERMDISDLPVVGCRIQRPIDLHVGKRETRTKRTFLSSMSPDNSNECVDLSFSSSSSSTDIFSSSSSSASFVNNEFYECECGAIQKLKYKFCKICSAPQPKKKEAYCAYCAMPCTEAICPHCGEENTQ